MESSRRERTLRGLAFLAAEFASLVQLHANHGLNRENLYWGSKRFHVIPAARVEALLRRRSADYFCGECRESPYFWGDACRERFEYVRNFTFRVVDVLSVNPEMPYRVANTPYVRHWFSATDAPDGRAFKQIITCNGLKRLESAGGVCIVSTHLGKGFTRAGRLDPEIDETLAYLAGRPGWFAPVSEILDHLRASTGAPLLGRVSLLRLELRFLKDQLGARLRARMGGG
jgi:hypothetical protein